MLKVRYFRLKFSDAESVSLTSMHDCAERMNNTNLAVVSSSAKDIVLTYQVIRQVRTVSFLEDGSELAQEHPTVDRYRVRLFEGGNRALFLSVIDPPRNSKVIADILDIVTSGARAFFEPISFDRPLVEEHTRQFEMSRLVSAKIKNFRVYDNAIGRLEVSSRTGLQANIAPFVEGKYYEVDSLTYEVISDLAKGLVTYSTNGTVKVSGPIVEVAFTRLESCL